MKQMEAAKKTNPAPIAKRGADYGYMTNNELDEAIGPSQAKELRQNKKMLDDSIITQEEFDKKTMQIFGIIKFQKTK
jgi:hypothetical protein